MLKAKEGLNFLLKTTFDALIHSERVAFLEKVKESYNKGNGFRPVLTYLNNGLDLELSIPRDRNGCF